ncbi:uncharacterized protein LOC110109210 [Dendrobium catenatum]|uniref:Calmodulin-binding domain-containing protein n=1 Tax=Dendrobium catenatum TaxID=906689 RepID=A0A2I0VPZ0_9ASPA|nr:uncharacterized protein LOC110109210 [Dendrobium catenatum]XP_020695827.1 uncharacterized protein LOC110109210 [Dendrobium catenatum]XP_028556280.1 uncharacterized protein LOC110109210 [Dendrobium catenatum]PKU65478.1 hypothetical protein MA16_Dca012200 [Dendrobium catenatum]
MNRGTPLSFLKNVIVSEQDGSFLEDGSEEKSELMVPEAISSTFYENTISIDDVPWAWSDGFSEGSAVMELESSISAVESMAPTPISHDHNIEGSSMEFEVTPRKMISLVSDKLINQVEESSNRLRSIKQEARRKSMASSMANLSKEQKQLDGLKVDVKQKREVPMLRSSLPVKTSLLGTVKAKQKVDAAVEPSITKEKSGKLDRTAKFVKPKQAGMVPDKGPRTSLSPIIIKKKTLSPPKRIQLSPKASLVLKTKSSAVKYRSTMSDLGRITGQSSQESSKIARNVGMPKLGGEKILKQFEEPQCPMSTVNNAPGLNNSMKLRSVKNQVEAGNVDGVKEKTLHVIEQTLVGVAQKSSEQNHIKLRSQQSSGTFSTGSSISSSAFLSSSYEDESDGSRLTISDASGSKKTHTGERKGRTPLHGVEQKLKTPKSAEQKCTKLRSQQSSRTFSSRSSISSSAFISSGYEEENDRSRLTINDASGSEKPHIGERKGRTQLQVEQKLFSVEQNHTKLRSQLSSRTHSSTSSISSSNDESQLTVSDASGSKKSQIGEENGTTPLYSLNSDYKEIQKRTENISLEDESLLLEKMSFSRGKKISPQREIPDHRRLTLMQEKAVAEAKNFEVQAGMSSFRESRESPTVGLRHQDMQEKNTEALFNDVSEEAGKKLVETRKSKVKALVSAFESIISLQERTV